MRNTNLIAVGFLFVLLAGANVYAQNSSDKDKKPQTTADAWRAAIPQAEQTGSAVLVPEESKDNVEVRETTAQTEKRILELEQRFMTSLKDRDLDSLKFLIADDFVFAGQDLPGAQSDKERFIRWVTGQLQVRSYEVDKVQVQAYPSTAIVTLKYKRLENVGGAASEGNFTVTNVWIKREKLWRITSHHISQTTTP